MKLFNTLTRKIEDFTPQDQQKVKIYTCGPTVYNFAHIGNFASYIYWDLLIRLLLTHHWRPYRVINITDVGHLASDGDDGIDKLEKGAKREQKTVWEIADFYTNAFLRDFRSLNLVEPDKIARATDYIKEDLQIVQTLLDKGYAYQISDGIYFDTSRFASYSSFAKLDLQNLKAGARVNFNPEKRHHSDFAIWKFIQKGEDHAMRWDFLNRPGYPGWHLECSAISHCELGEPLDIHTGGIDHIPVHHTNEIAQSEASFNQLMSRFWLHCNFITVEHQKISKSLGNTFTLADLRQRGFSPLDYKMWIFQGHFQSERNFTFQDLTVAKARRLKWKNHIAELIQKTPVSSYLSTEKQISNSQSQLNSSSVSQEQLTILFKKLLAQNQTPKTKLSQQIFEIVSDNLNSAEAFSIIDQNTLNLADWAFVEQLFGLQLFKEQNIPTSEILTLIKDREQARRNRDFKTSDNLRDQILTTGFTVKDQSTGPIWQYTK